MPVENPFIPPTKSKIVAPKDQGQPEPDLTDQILKIRREKKIEQMIDREFPTPPQPKTTEGAKKPDEETQPTVLNKALEMMDHGVQRAEAAAADKQKDIDEARKSENKAKEELYQTQQETIKMVLADYKETMKDLRSGAAKPMGAVEILDTGDRLMEAVLKRIPRPEPAPTGASSEIQLKLQDMQHKHELEMARLNLEINKIGQEFEFKKAEFEDKKQREWMEYGDKKKFREDGLGGLTDLLQSIGENITVERQAAEGVAKSQASKAEPGLSAHISKFVCPKCHSPVTVPDGQPAGQTKATCEQCGTEYDITQEAQ